MRPENQRIANQAARTIITSNALFRHAPDDGDDARPVRIPVDEPHVRVFMPSVRAHGDGDAEHVTRVQGDGRAQPVEACARISLSLRYIDILPFLTEGDSRRPSDSLPRPPDVYLEVQHPLLVLQFQQFVGECLGGRPVAQHAHGTVVGLVDTISRSSPAMSIRISLSSGGYRRIMPFPFSLLPRRRLEYGSAKHVSMPGPSRRRVWRANPVPLSCVTPPRAPAGSGENIASRAPTLSPAVLPGTIPAMRNLVFLSTSVCGLHPAPITPSASQWPKPLRSPASGGRPEMGARPGIGKRDVLPPPRPRRLLLPRGRRHARRSR